MNPSSFGLVYHGFVLVLWAGVFALVLYWIFDRYRH